MDLCGLLVLLASERKKEREAGKKPRDEDVLVTDVSMKASGHQDLRVPWFVFLSIKFCQD